MMETNDSAVHLLKEWKRINSEGEDVPEFISRYGIESLIPYRAALKRYADRLDQMAEDAGIKIHADGMVSFTKFGDHTDSMVCPRVYGHELHAILEWLLIKNEK